MVFHRFEIGSKAMNIVEIASKSDPRSSVKGQSNLGTFVVPSSDGESEAGCGEAIFHFRFENSVKV